MPMYWAGRRTFVSAEIDVYRARVEVERISQEQADNLARQRGPGCSPPIRASCQYECLQADHLEQAIAPTMY